MIDVPAIVIGSGYGGAVAALRLGEAKIDTLVLERGRRWDIAEPATNAKFATFERPDGRAEWLNTVTRTPAYDGTPIEKYTGVLELTKLGDYMFMSGAGVGGGSLVYGGILIQPTKRLFNQVFPSFVRYEEMDAIYYPRVRSIIGVEPIPDDILNSEYYLGLKVLREHAVRSGFTERDSHTHPDGDSSILFPMAVDWDFVREEISGKRVPSVIGAQFWWGNNSGAKRSLERDYLKLAEETGHVSIRPLHEVTSIAATESGAYRVSYNILLETGRVIEGHSATCKRLFLAAGTLVTNRLLLEARARRGLKNLSEELGRNFGNNGDTFIYRTNLEETTNPHLGGPGALAVQNYTNSLAPCLMMRAPLPRFAQDFPHKNAIGAFVFCQTSNRGTLSWNAATDSMDLDFRPDAVAQACATSLAKRLSRSSGGDVSTPTFNITGHQLGGACIGAVCDEYGRVRGCSGLYVVDGSLMPGSTTPTNPAFTIAAIAERCMETIVATDCSHI